MTTDTPTEPTAAKRHPGGAIVRRAAGVLGGTNPGAALALICNAKISTVRSWMKGHRRPPVTALKAIERALQLHVVEASEALRDLERHTLRRQAEPIKRRGFFVHRMEREARRPDGRGWYSVPDKKRNRQ